LGGLALASSAGAWTGGSVLTASLAATSDFVFRGVSQSDGKPALQAGVEVEHPAGLFAGVWASTVEFGGELYRNDPRDLELDLYAGYGLELSRSWSLVGSVVRYTYPRADTPFDYDYDELGVAVQYRRAVLATSYSDNALGTQGAGFAWELTGQLPLRHGLEAGGGAGFYYLRVSEDDYLYWHLSLSRPWRRLKVQLAYIDTDGAARRRWGDTAGSRFVLSAAMAVWPLNPGFRRLD
jgi:uncharacterized protein (TIGR02001 family)